MGARCCARRLVDAPAPSTLALSTTFDIWGLYKPELMLHAASSPHAAGDALRSRQVVQRTATWVDERASCRDVPAVFIDSFLHRKPINRELLTWAGRPGHAPGQPGAPITSP